MHKLHHKKPKTKRVRDRRWWGILAVSVFVLTIAVSTAFAVVYDPPLLNVDASAIWDASSAKAGPHTLTATAYDAAGNSDTATVTVEVYGAGTVVTTMPALKASKTAIYLETVNTSSLLSGKLYSGSKELTTSPVHVWTKPSVEETWTYLGQATYGKTAGYYQYRVSPTRTSDYQFRYNGNSWYAHSASPTLKIPVWTEVK